VFNSAYFFIALSLPKFFIMALIPILISAVFILGYIAIAFEHSLKLNKAATALITGVFCWTIYILQSDSIPLVNEELLHHLGDIASILFFLMGAMTIVETIDSHNGFNTITKKISTSSMWKLLCIVSALTFLLSALLDNLTTAIVMTSLCAKILTNKNDRLWFAGMIVIAANAGGVWSPLGDVSTTMLWIGRQITAMSIIKQLFLPSLGVCLVPLLLMAWKFKGKKFNALKIAEGTDKENRDSNIVFFTGVGLLLFVPAFKTLTHLPPFMGMLLALGLMWVTISLVHINKSTAKVEKYKVSSALQRIDTPSILFFLGILLAVSALQSFGIMKVVAASFSSAFKNDYLIGIALGLLSALVDNVPLVAAAQGMYDLSTYPTDHVFWTFLALTTGTGGSAIIIGSAAGVAVMGIEQMDFIWYLKKISWLALIGFVVGILLFLLQASLIFN
jgi:Na+/H+ antiporter NhaD/arsenite permease-like protein